MNNAETVTEADSRRRHLMAL